MRRRGTLVLGFWMGLFVPAVLGCLGGKDDGAVSDQKNKPVGLPPRHVAQAGSGSGSGAPAPETKTKNAAQQGDQRVVVLVFDGVDPDRLDAWRSTLPNVDGLVGSATQVRRLATTSPPASPVVWASFETSRSPQKHGVFGAVVRDPLTYLPRPGDLELRAVGDDDSPAIESYRSGTPFWEVAASAGIATKVLFAPYPFPIRDVAGLQLLAGEGTPDLRGTWGSYTVFDTQATRGTPTSGTLVRLEDEGGLLSGSLLGPDGASGPSSIPITFEPRPPDSVVIKVGAEATPVTARVGDFTAWTPVTFTVGSSSVRGKTRFFPISVGARTEVYASPIVIDAAAPWIPVSTPADWAKKLADTYGELKLVGWEHETQGWTDGVVPADVMVRDRASLQKVRNAAILGEIDQNDGTRLIVAFDHDADRVWHALSAQIDRSSPAYDAQVAATYGPMVKECYVDIDLLIGDVVKRLGPKDRLYILSGSGFHPWQWEVNLNAWLKAQGYLALAPGAGTPAQIGGRLGADGVTWTWDVDWAHTRAYAVGGGAIYLNVEGRESHGIVGAAQAGPLAAEIEKKLLAWDYDLKSSRSKVVGEVKNHVAETERNVLQPDLQVGFTDGFGASRATWAGLVPTAAPVEKNTRIFYGDHASNASTDTAGFVLGNSKSIPADANILDIGPTVLGILGVAAPADYEGRAWK